jgi:O-6-methylguanine DNA methyltransferase
VVREEDQQRGAADDQRGDPVARQHAAPEVLEAEHAGREPGSGEQEAAQVEPVARGLALDLRGTPFQLEVWSALREIPYGETRSYADIAREVGRPSAVRAVGAANGANPLSIVVPCHRVIASDGRLQGYGGGVSLKAKLLAMEQSRPAQGLLL